MLYTFLCYIQSVRDANGDKIPFVNGRKGKKSVGSYDDDDNDGDGGGGAEGDRLHKVYLKLPFAIKVPNKSNLTLT